MSDNENTYEDHIEVTPEAEPPYEVAEVEAVAPTLIEQPIIKRGPKWTTVILTGLIAGLVGAGAGAAALYTLAPKLIGTDGAQVATLERQIETRISALDTRLQTAEARAPSRTDAFDPTDLDQRLAALETAPVFADDITDRIAVLEAAPRPEIDPAALSALQAAQADGFQWPDTKLIETALVRIDERLLSLEADDADTSDVMNRLAALENRPVETTMPDDIIARLDAMEQRDAETGMPPELIARLDALESREPEAVMSPELMDRIAALESAPAPVAVPRFVLPFPKAEMLRAVDANREGGFMSRTLSKHVRVKSDDDPTTLINGITADIADGDLDAAAAKFDRLPEAVQAPGRAWYASLKDTP